MSKLKDLLANIRKLDQQRGTLQPIEITTKSGMKIFGNLSKWDSRDDLIVISPSPKDKQLIYIELSSIESVAAEES